MASRKSKEQAIKEFERAHGSTYDYSQVEYANGSTKVKIGCRTHGTFEQQPRAHAAGQGCPRCNQRPNWVHGRRNFNYFLKKAKEVHQDKYTYSGYRSLSHTITITCPMHGIFTAKAAGHLAGRGCPKCAGNQRKSNEEFERDARSVHGDKYDYSSVTYITSQQEVTITCPTHGSFQQTPTSHLAGHGCQVCGLTKCQTVSLSNIDAFIASAKAVHGDTYDYSACQYERATKPINIICRNHGIFRQRPRDHVNSTNGCPKCAGNQKLTTEEFIGRAANRWGGLYSYDRSVYVTGKDKITVTCHKHGDFQITASYHLADGGCPHCSLSTEQHDLVEFVKSSYSGEIRINDRTAIRPLELDLYLPQKSLAIELNGNYFHSYNRQETSRERERHRHKHSVCAASGLHLLQFTDYEWNRKADLVKSMIANKLGLSRKIGARQCKLVTNVAPDFFRANHIHGFKKATLTAGLEFEGEVVCAMSWSTHPKYSWEVCRLASKSGTVVVGGVRRLLTWFLHTCNAKSLFTYADKRFSTGGVYRALGFKEIGSTRPNYQYLDSLMKPHSRIKFQKHKLSNILENFDPAASESQNMFNNGHRRLWDAGHYKFLLSGACSR